MFAHFLHGVFACNPAFLRAMAQPDMASLLL
jgi:hypothetical protein